MSSHALPFSLLACFLSLSLLIHHDVIEYSDLNGEIGMTPDVDKMNDNDDIIWNENNRGDSMEQILHVVEPQCVADVLLSHADEQW